MLRTSERVANNTMSSERVRAATREQYLGPQDERRRAMQQFVGTRTEPSEKTTGAVESLRSLRRSVRLDKLHQKVTVLVDSDILVEVSRGRDLRIVSNWMNLSDSDALSSIHQLA